MTRSKETEQVRKVHDQLEQEAQAAWQRRNCPPPSRFWKVALGQSTWATDEQRHVESCADCQAAQGKIAATVRAPAMFAAAKLTALATLVVRRRLSRLPAVNRFADQTAAVSEEQLTFDEDPNLTAVLFREGGEHWLHLEHSQLPVGTLLRIEMSVPDGRQPTWSRYVVLRPGLKHAVARMRVEKAFPTDAPELEMSIHVIRQAAALPAEAAVELREAFLQAKKDDPSAVTSPRTADASAWQMWAQGAATELDVKDEVHRVIVEIAETASAGKPSRKRRR